MTPGGFHDDAHSATSMTSRPTTCRPASPAPHPVDRRQIGSFGNSNTSASPWPGPTLLCAGRTRTATSDGSPVPANTEVQQIRLVVFRRAPKIRSVAQIPFGHLALDPTLLDLTRDLLEPQTPGPTADPRPALTPCPRRTRPRPYSRRSRRSRRRGRAGCRVR